MAQTLQFANYGPTEINSYGIAHVKVVIIALQKIYTNHTHSYETFCCDSFTTSIRQTFHCCGSEVAKLWRSSKNSRVLYFRNYVYTSFVKWAHPLKIWHIILFRYFIEVTHQILFLSAVWNWNFPPSFEKLFSGSHFIGAKINSFKCDYF